MISSENLFDAFVSIAMSAENRESDLATLNAIVSSPHSEDNLTYECLKNGISDNFSDKSRKLILSDKCKMALSIFSLTFESREACSNRL